MIEDEVVHWWKDENGKQHRTILRIEREDASEQKGFPRDGALTLRIINTIGQTAIKLSPDEGLRASTQILAASKELLNQKRRLWQSHDGY